MLLTNGKLVGKMLWPTGFAVFSSLGILTAIIADVLSAFIPFLTPFFFICVFGALALIAVSLCFQRVILLSSRDPYAFNKVVTCGVCRVMRFSLFALTVYFILLGLGRGHGLTRYVFFTDEIRGGENQVASGAAAETENVLENIAYKPEIITSPDTPEKYFHNAWVYANIHSDSSRAFEVLEEMYNKFNPNKMDAAELYYETGKKSTPVNVLNSRAKRIAISVQDAALLVLVARNTQDEKASEVLYLEAQAIDPDNPFAVWDIQRFPRGGTPATDAQTHYKILKKRLEATARFEKMLDANPKEKYFYLPQYQPDFKKVALQMQAALDIASQAYHTLGDEASKAVAEE